MRGTFTGAVALLAALAATAVPAAGPQWPLQGTWYLGGSVGYASADARLSRFSTVANPCVTVACRVSIDDDSVSLGAFAGYQFTPYVAAELGYADLPDSYSVRQEDPRFPSPTLLDVDQDSRAFTLRGVFTLPMKELGPDPILDRVSLSGVIGLSRWRSESTFISDIRGAGGGVIRVTDTDNGTDLSFGARINYDVTEQVRVSGTWDRYMGLGDSSVAVPRAVPPLQVQSVRSPVDVFSLGVSYRFR